MRMRTPSVIAGLLIFFTMFHFLAIHFHFYWTVWWYDIGMHVFGGFIAALIFLFLFQAQYQSRLSLLIISISAALIVGIAWEIFEYITGVTFTTEAAYIPDTVTDLFDDLAGGLIAYMTVYPKRTTEIK
jgi:hypothetical protein